ncbi:MAG: helix-turn-helix protein [Solirubrobacteraceae bacterium]|nr:helix-turn-helix protein [Solirubrobacteraceae bacterium]
MSTAADLLRQTRLRHGISQRSLARRAGTSQSWISDIERGRVSPTEDALRRVLLCLGEDLVLSTQRLEGHSHHNPDALRRARSESMAERLVEGASWAELASAMHLGE